MTPHANDDLMQLHAGIYSPPPVYNKRLSRVRRLSKLPQPSIFLRPRSHDDHKVTKELLETFLVRCTLEEIQSSISTLLKIEFFTPNTVHWLIDWATDDSTSSIGIASIASLGFLAFPDQKIPGICDLIFNTPGLVKDLLRITVENKLCLSKQIHPDEIQFGEKLGSGAGGIVYEALYKDKSVAVKKFKKDGLWFSDEKDYYYESAIICLFGSFKHFIHCFGVNDDEGFIVMPLALNKSLDHVITEGLLEELTWDDKLKIIYQISKALKTLHQYGIIHRDIKPSNILLDHEYNCYLTDFGVISFGEINISTTKQHRKRALTLNVGTNIYMAPEVSLGNGLYYSAIDVYSFGVIMWQLVTNCSIPYLDQGISLREVSSFVSSGKRLEIPSDCPQPFAKLISKCWHSNPKKRPSFNQLTITFETLLTAM
mmetsp:Transcript_11828/g.20240  ORF Transcript_11828/g.20240 Transcript_11828/m.20240 type:complete len:427 (-) Transcript_11828:36-1316(-)